MILTLVQGVEYIFPLLVIPFLVRRLGVEVYGGIVFAQAVCLYFLLITDFGFGLSAVKRVVELKGDANSLSRLFWNVQSVKFLLFTASSLVLALLVIAVPKLNSLSDFLVIAMLPALGSILLPQWIYQGLDKVGYASVTLLLVRAVSVACIVGFIQSPGDAPLAAVFLLAVTPVAGLLLTTFLFKEKIINWQRPTRNGTVEAFLDSRHVFYSTAASSVYRSTNAVVLGFISGPSAVAIYSIAERVVKAAQELSRPLAQASYPKICRLAVAEIDKAKAFARRLLLMYASLGLGISLLLIFFSSQIVFALGGADLGEAGVVLKILSIAPLIGCLNLIFGSQTMHPFGYSQEFSKFILISGVVNLCLLYPLIIYFGVNGAAICFVASEFVLLANLLVFHRRHGLILGGKHRYA